MMTPLPPGTLIWEVFGSTPENLQGVDLAMEQFTVEREKLINILHKLHSKGIVVLWLLNDPFRARTIFIKSCTIHLEKTYVYYLFHQ